MLKVLFSFITFCLMAKAHAAGFANGNALIATPIQGQVQVQCNGFNGSGTALYTCRDVVMDPQAYDYFVGPQDARADKVELMAFHEDGSSRSKVNNYDGARGKSRDAFNLWISTLFQKPLLEYGRNTIRYKIFSDNSTPYAQGEFGVVVQRGTARQCPAATYHSTDSNDCNSQYSICQRYFEEYRNCH